jgi:hypothetical protein
MAATHAVYSSMGVAVDHTAICATDDLYPSQVCTRIPVATSSDDVGSGASCSKLPLVLQALNGINTVNTNSAAPGCWVGEDPLVHSPKIGCGCRPVPGSDFVYLHPEHEIYFVEANIRLWGCGDVPERSWRVLAAN